MRNQALLALAVAGLVVGLVGVTQAPAAAAADRRAADAADKPAADKAEASASNLPGRSRPQPELSLPGVSPGDRLQTLLAHFDEAQRAIVTLQADFSERKELSLLREPVESSGHFYYSRPDKARWSYERPEAKVFLITDNRLLQYFPADRLLEKKDLRASNTTRLFKLFGLGQTSKQLGDFYEMRLQDDPGATGAYLLVLTPRRRIIEKRLAKVYLWVGDQDFLPRAMKYQEADGDVTHLTFTNVRVNEVLADATFTLEVPRDVRVRDEITLFTAGKKSAP